MSRVPMGKVLLRNVIRHTDAHNKIQEESEMWKMREMERQAPRNYSKWPRSKSPRGRMRCDGYDDDEREATSTYSSEKDSREARYWTKKLYDFEANDPNRWGHSGFKELYPEEFQTESDSDEENVKESKHSGHSAKSSTQESRKRKRSKKASRKEKKKSAKKHKKRKKEENSELESEDSSSDEKYSKKRRAKRKVKKSKKAKLKSKKDSSRESDSGSSEEEQQKQTQRKKKKHHQMKMEETTVNHEIKNKRKNWKIANDEKSEESSED
ncbi:uncharacterized protein NKAPD1 isoform X1 [Polypterus senegalus]|uniref:uncharacterized protein NKAPD1 isoform X1 n=1 Tax=Polypterus senegalus TaxID=55291 RepID=UPI001963E574|nr:uncharacterized protein NKAPD1 isoform X1 [Polypterus senegalus]XP_039619831.1 uncharacterized protein NKAPD1 isoform X1 [Polypterus senegalus]